METWNELNSLRTALKKNTGSGKSNFLQLSEDSPVWYKSSFSLLIQQTIAMLCVSRWVTVLLVAW